MRTKEGLDRAEASEEGSGERERVSPKILTAA